MFVSLKLIPMIIPNIHYRNNEYFYLIILDQVPHFLYSNYICFVLIDFSTAVMIDEPYVYTKKMVLVKRPCLSMLVLVHNVHVHSQFR